MMGNIHEHCDLPDYKQSDDQVISRKEDVEFEVAMHMAVTDICEFIKVQSMERQGLVLDMLGAEIEKLRALRTEVLLGPEGIFRRAVVVKRAEEVFGSPDKAKLWLNSPIPALGGQVPMPMTNTEEGAGLVLDCLGQIEWGLYS